MVRTSSLKRNLLTCSFLALLCALSLGVRASWADEAVTTPGDMLAVAGAPGPAEGTVTADAPQDNGATAPAGGDVVQAGTSPAGVQTSCDETAQRSTDSSSEDAEGAGGGAAANAPETGDDTGQQQTVPLTGPAPTASADTVGAGPVRGTVVVVAGETATAPSVICAWQSGTLDASCATVPPDRSSSTASLPGTDAADATASPPF